jgi:hypothetical protein
MKEWLKFFTDKRFLIPVIFVICFELLLQSGIYTPFLRKNSYAANVNRIINHVVDMKKVHDPDIIVLGTSVAYQGLSMRILQDRLNAKGLKIQSIAIPGSELIVQELVTQKVLKEFKNVKLLIYVAEVTMPWVSQRGFYLPTLAMIGEFSKIDFLPMLIEYEYTYKYDDIAYLLFKSIAYRRDLKDFITDPGKRLKHISKASNNPNLKFYDFENEYYEKISSYQITSMDDCIAKTKNWGNPPYPESSPEHKKAVFETCDLALVTQKYLLPTKQTKTADTPETELYFRRLQKVFSHYQNQNIKILTIFAPYSHIIKEIGGNEKMDVWNRKLAEVLKTENPPMADFQNIFTGKDSNAYCYDTIHLNHQGMELFSESLAEYLDKNIEKIISKKE